MIAKSFFSKRSWILGAFVGLEVAFSQQAIGQTPVAMPQKVYAINKGLQPATSGESQEQLSKTPVQDVVTTPTPQPIPNQGTVLVPPSINQVQTNPTVNPVPVNPPVSNHHDLSPAPFVYGPVSPKPAVIDGAMVDSEFMARRSWWDKLCHKYKKGTIEDLTALVDELDREVFKIGVVAVKSADVWGQNRMTKFRVEYENQMQLNVSSFIPILSAKTRQGDSATLTSATAIGLGKGSGTNTTTGSKSTVTNVAPPNVTVPVISASPPSGSWTPFIGTPSIGDPTPFVGAGGTNNIKAANVTLGLKPINATADSTDHIGLEPTIVLDEQSRFLYHLQELRRINTGDDTTDMPGYGLYLVRMPVSLIPGSRSFKGKGASVTVQASHYLPPDLLPTSFRDLATNDLADCLSTYLTSLLEDDCIRNSTPEEIRCAAMTLMKGPLDLKDGNPTIRKQVSLAKSAKNAILHPVGGHSAAGNLRLKSIIPSEIYNISGPVFLLSLAADFKELKMQIVNRDFSLRNWLKEELKGIYAFIKANENDPHFSVETINHIGQMIELKNYNKLGIARDQWVSSLPGFGHNPELDANNNLLPPLPKTQEILAFAIIVEQYFLDKILKEDMESIFQQKSCHHGNPHEELFYPLNPSENARAIYNAYVAAKWPIKVFAIDPTVDQQNIQEISSVRRELQIAVAIALSTGQISVNKANNFARRMESDIETIGLNRTAVAFGAGDKTFGWKFYPRIQAHQPESNPRAIFDLLLFGGPGPYYDIRHRKIEPGQRECTALVVMPTFVPYLRLDTTTNWFDLTGHCQSQEISNKEMLDLGHMVQLARGGLSHLCDSCGYRPTDLQGLATRVEQLEAQLPMQTQIIPLAYENTLSGSEVYSQGYSHLAPQLLDWVGTPAAGKPFNIMISGHHFSVHETKVIAGGVEIPSTDYYLLSRDLMMVKIPAGVQFDSRENVLEKDRNGVSTTRTIQTLDIHVASPNGPSNHLLVEIGADTQKTTTPPIVTGGPSLSWINVGDPNSVTGIQLTNPMGNTDLSKLAFGNIRFLSNMDKLVIGPTPLFGNITPSTLAIVAKRDGTVIYANGFDTTAITINFDIKNNQITIMGKDFNTIQQDLNKQLLLYVQQDQGVVKSWVDPNVAQIPINNITISLRLAINGVVYDVTNDLKYTVNISK